MVVCSQGSSLMQIAPWPTDLIKMKSYDPCYPFSGFPETQAPQLKTRGAGCAAGGWQPGTGCVCLACEYTDKPVWCSVLKKTGLRSTNKGKREGCFCTLALVSTKLYDNFWDHHLSVKLVWRWAMRAKVRMERLTGRHCNPVHKHTCWKTGETSGRRRQCCLRAFCLLKRPGWFGAQMWVCKWNTPPLHATSSTDFLRV